MSPFRICQQQQQSVMDAASCAMCGGQPVSVVVAALQARDGEARTPYWQNHTRFVPHVTVLRAVDGLNHTETLHALLESGLAFHNLSRGNRRWGKLATFLTKHRALVHQVERRLPWQLTLEEDVILQQPICRFLRGACAAYPPDLSVMQLSDYAELMLTSLQGARRLRRRLPAVVAHSATGARTHAPSRAESCRDAQGRGASGGEGAHATAASSGFSPAPHLHATRGSRCMRIPHACVGSCACACACACAPGGFSRRFARTEFSRATTSRRMHVCTCMDMYIHARVHKQVHVDAHAHAHVRARCACMHARTHARHARVCSHAPLLGTAVRRLPASAVRRLPASFPASPHPSAFGQPTSNAVPRPPR